MTARKKKVPIPWTEIKKAEIKEINERIFTSPEVVAAATKVIEDAIKDAGKMSAPSMTAVRVAKKVIESQPFSQALADSMLKLERVMTERQNKRLQEIAPRSSPYWSADQRSLLAEQLAAKPLRRVSRSPEDIARAWAPGATIRPRISPEPMAKEQTGELVGREWHVARASISQTSGGGYGPVRLTISAELIAIDSGSITTVQVGDADLLIDILEGALVGLRGVAKFATPRAARVPKKKAAAIRRRLAKGDRI
jgi:hypothetical protein